MIRDCDIIIFSLSRWDAPYSSPSFSLAKEFAKNNRVFYIDHPFSVKDFFAEFTSPRIRQRAKALLAGEEIYTRVPDLPEKLTIVTTGLTLPINFLPAGSVYDFFARLNDAIVFTTMRRIIRDHQVKDFVFLNAFDPYFCRDFPDDIKPLRKVYQSMDDLTQVAYTARHGTRLEQDIIRKFDVTLTTSQELKRLKSSYSDAVYYHPNAADTSTFQQALMVDYPRPPELAPAEGKKIIGYTGNIESRIDYALLKSILENHPDKYLVMVGPVTTDEHKTINLTDFPNVIMVGPKKIHALPQYLQYFDCALIPFKKNVLTKSIYPLKINEYLAAGRPVVTTDFSDDIKSFSDVVYVADNHADFVQSINSAIDEHDGNRIRERVFLARRNTWRARVEEFWNILERKNAHRRAIPMNGVQYEMAEH